LTPHIFTIPVGATSGRPPLSNYGQIIDDAINNIPTIYPNTAIDKYVIMPNHVHMLISLYNNDGRAMPAPTEQQSFMDEQQSPVPKIGRVIQQLKGYISKQIGSAIWQKGFYDHVIRDEQDYMVRWEYIDENPLKWQDDELFQE